MSPSTLIDSILEALTHPLLAKIFATLTAIVVTLLLLSMIRRKFVYKIGDATKRSLARKIINGTGYLVCIIIIVSAFSDTLGKLTVVLGVTGAGIAFALQEVIASVAGWFMITFGFLYRDGDRIQLGGIRGDVIDIGVLRTTLMECGAWVNGDLYNGRIVRVSNSFVFKEPVFNYSADFEFLWDEIVIPIRPGTNIKQVQEVLERVAQEVVGGYAERAKISWSKSSRSTTSKTLR